MLNLFRGGKVTSGLSTLRSEDSNCKGGDAVVPKLGAPPPHHHRPRLAPHPPHHYHLQRAPPPPHHHHGQRDNQLDPPLDPHHHGQRDNQLDPPLDPHRHPPLDPHPDQTQECILVTQQWVRQQQ
nr:hypothetical protein [Tanacetum cinerariifolium]